MTNQTRFEETPMANPLDKLTEAAQRLLGKAQPEDNTPGPVSRNDAEEVQEPSDGSGEGATRGQSSGAADGDDHRP